MVRALVVSLVLLLAATAADAPPVTAFSSDELRASLAAIVAAAGISEAALQDEDAKQLAQLVRPYVRGGEDDEAALRALVASRFAVYRRIGVRLPHVLAWAYNQGPAALDYPQLVLVSRVCATCDDHFGAAFAQPMTDRGASP